MFRYIKERLSDVLILPAFLVLSLYIGIRQQEGQARKAKEALEGAIAKGENIDIGKVAEEYGAQKEVLAQLVAAEKVKISGGKTTGYDPIKSSTGPTFVGQAGIVTKQEFSTVPLILQKRIDVAQQQIAQPGPTKVSAQILSQSTPKTKSIRIAIPDQKDKQKLQIVKEAIVSTPTGSKKVDISSKTRFESRIENIERLEEAKKEFKQKVGFDRGFQMFVETPSRLIGTSAKVSTTPLFGARGGSFIGSFTEGATKSILGAPFFVADVVSEVPIVTSKVLAISEGLIRPSTRKSTFREVFIQAPKKTVPVFKSQIKGAEGAGFLLGAAAVPKLSGGLGKGIETISAVTSKKFTPQIKPIEAKPGVKSIIEITSEFGQEPIQIEVVGSFKWFEEPISKQTKQAGQTINAVSAQRGLFNPLKRKIKVEKPLPTKDSPQLERAFFADPAGRLRPSRLGIEGVKTATFSDILSGRATFKPAQPQALVFEQVKVAEFPKSLKGVESKLKSGKSITPEEQRALEKFQLTPSGQFKPVGFLSREPEVVLAPGEIIVRGEVAGITVISGRKVPIFRSKVIEASKETRELLIKHEAGKLNKRQTKSLELRLEKETGFSSRPVVKLPSLGFAVSTLPSKSLSVLPRSKTSNINSLPISRLPREPSILMPSGPVSSPTSRAPSGPISLPISSLPSSLTPRRPTRRLPISVPPSSFSSRVPSLLPLKSSLKELPTLIPKLDGFEGKKKPKKKGAKQFTKTKLTPSLVAVVQKIYGPRTGRGGIVSGLEIRGI